MRKHTVKYLQIKNELKQQILSGLWPSGTKLPSEQQLCRCYGVSRITVSAALKALSEEHLICRRRGSGTYVDVTPLEKDYDDLFTHIAGPVEHEITYGVVAPTPLQEFVLKTLAGIFQVENPGVRVRIVSLPHPEKQSDDAYLVCFANNDIPTCGEFFWHSAYSSRNALLSLEKLPGYDNLLASLHPQAGYKTEDGDGNRYVHALSLYVSSRLIIVNTELLRRAGVVDFDVPLTLTRLQDWIFRLERLADKASREQLYAFFLDRPRGWRGVIGTMPYLWQGVPYSRYNPNSEDCFRELFNTVYCRQGLEFLAAIHRQARPAPETGYELFALGKVGILLSTSNWPIVLREVMSPKPPLRAYLIPAVGTGGGVNQRHILAGHSVGIFRAGVRHERDVVSAWSWLRFLFRKQQQFMLTNDYSLPVRRGMDCLMQRNYPQVHQVLIEAMQESRPQFDFTGIRSALAIVGRELLYLYVHQCPVQETCERIMAKLDRNS